MYRTLLPSPDAGGFAPRPYAVRLPAAGARAAPHTPDASAGSASQYDMNDGFLVPGGEFQGDQQLPPVSAVLPSRLSILSNLGSRSIDVKFCVH